MRSLNSQFSSLVIALTVLLALGVSSGIAATQQFVGHTNDFTCDSNGDAYWQLNGSDIAVFGYWKTNSWTYNDNYVKTTDGTYALTDNAVERVTGIGGVVYHFESVTPQKIDLLTYVNYYFGNWAGHTFDFYFSDENDWSNLDGMIGGTWDQAETNSLWTVLHQNRVWGASGSGPQTNSVITTDGNFWIRVDFSTTDGAGAGWIKALFANNDPNGIGISVTGTKFPEGTVITIK